MDNSNNKSEDNNWDPITRFLLKNPIGRGILFTSMAMIGVALSPFMINQVGKIILTAKSTRVMLMA